MSDFDAERFPGDFGNAFYEKHKRWPYSAEMAAAAYADGLRRAAEIARAYGGPSPSVAASDNYCYGHKLANGIAAAIEREIKDKP